VDFCFNGMNVETDYFTLHILSDGVSVIAKAGQGAWDNGVIGRGNY